MRLLPVSATYNVCVCLRKKILRGSVNWSDLLPLSPVPAMTIPVVFHFAQGLNTNEVVNENEHAKTT